MGFHVAAKFTRMVFELASGGGEGVADRDIDVCVGLVLGAVAVDHDLALRDAHIDPHIHTISGWREPERSKDLAMSE